MKLLLDNGNQHIGRHGAPDLRLDGVLAVAQELLDSQVLLDPFEEQFDLPAILVKGSNSQRRQGKIVCQKYERLATLRVVETYTPQIVWVMLSGIKPVECDGLIAYEPCGSVDWAGINSSSIRIGFGACYEKSAHLMQPIKSGEIQIAAVHYVERPSFDWQKIQHVDFVHLAVAYMDKRRDCASQIQQRVQFDCALGLAKRRPVKQAQAQIDRRRVQSVNRVLEIESDQVGVAVKLACSTNQQRSHICPNAPVARLVRIGQRRAMNAVTQTHRIQFGRIGPQRYFDIAKALSPRQLRKCHDAKLLRTGHATNTCVAAVAVDDTTEARPWHELHYLRKKCLADVHEKFPRD